MHTVVITGPIRQEGLDILQRRPDVRVVAPGEWSHEVAERVLPEAHGILVRTQKLPRDVLALAPHLRVVSRFGVGVDNVDWQYLTGRGIPLTVTTGSNSAAVAEQTLALMLAMAKNLHAAQASVTGGDWAWRNHNGTSELRGKTVLVLGFGNIGRAVAALCTAFAMRVVAYSRSLGQSPLPGVEVTQDFRARLPEADFITLHLPHTPETHHILTAADMGRLKRGAFLVNVGRGQLLDEILLAKALADGTLGGVGLDVYESEPPDPASPLFSHSRSFFTPHNAGLTRECMIAMSTTSAQNLLDALDGRLDPRMVFNKTVLGEIPGQAGR